MIKTFVTYLAFPNSWIAWIFSPCINISASDAIKIWDISEKFEVDAILLENFLSQSQRMR